MKKPFCSVILIGLFGAVPASALDSAENAGQQECVIAFLEAHVLGKELAESRREVLLKEGELEAEVLVTRRVTNLVRTPNGLQFDMLSNRKQTNFDVGSDGKRTGNSYVKDTISVSRCRVGERRSTGELIGIVDDYYASKDDYPYSPMSLKMRMDGAKLVLEYETIHYQDLYGKGDKWTPGIIQVTLLFSVVDGKLQLRKTECGIDLDVQTGQRTTRPKDLVSISTEVGPDD